MVLQGVTSNGFWVRASSYYHAGSGVLAYERISEHLGELTHPEGDVLTVLPQRSDAFLGMRYMAAAKRHSDTFTTCFPRILQTQNAKMMQVTEKKNSSRLNWI